MSQENNSEDELFRHLRRSEFHLVKLDYDELLFRRIFFHITEQEFITRKAECFSKHNWTEGEFKTRCQHG